MSLSTVKCLRGKENSNKFRKKVVEQDIQEDVSERDHGSLVTYQLMKRMLVFVYHSALVRIEMVSFLEEQGFEWCLE